MTAYVTARLTRKPQIKILGKIKDLQVFTVHLLISVYSAKNHNCWQKLGNLNP